MAATEQREPDQGHHIGKPKTTDPCGPIHPQGPKTIEVRMPLPPLFSYDMQRHLPQSDLTFAYLSNPPP